MHFSLSTILAASALLFPASLAAPLPNNDNNNGQNTCSGGGGVGVGNSIYRPANGGVKVKQGDRGLCPSGWTRSLLEADLCIQVGGNDHNNEKQQNRGDPIYRAVHTASPYWGPKSTTTHNPHRATHTSAPQKDEWTPRGGGGNNKKVTSSATPTERAHSPTPSSSLPLNRIARPTTSPAATPCPEGQTLGTGSLMDVCIDTDPLYLGGGIKLGGRLPPSSSATTTTKGRSGSRTTSASPSPTPSGRCSEGTSYDALLDICVDIDTDPLFLGGGIKIGGSPQSQGSSPSSPRNGSPTPRPGSPQSGSARPDSQDDMPECDGDNDPRAFLDLCVNVGNLLGTRIKLGGSPSDSGSGSGSGSDRASNATPAGSRSPQSTPFNNSPIKGLKGDPNNSNSNKSKPANGSLPPCNGPDDPDALLDLCVQVGDLLGADAKIGGSSDPQSNRSPNNAKVLSSPSNSGNDDGNILDLNLGNLLNAKIGSGPRPSSTTTTSSSPTPTPRKVKQIAPIVTYPQSDRDNSWEPRPQKNVDNDTPLLSVSASARVDLGPSSTSQAPRGQRPTSRAPTPTPKVTKDCPVGQILHLGVCVEVDADVLGLVSASAAATVAV